MSRLNTPLGSQTVYLRERWSAGPTSVPPCHRVPVRAHPPATRWISSVRLLPWNKYFYSGLGSFLQSSAQGITLQTSVGGGIGRYLKNTNRSKISVLGGLSWQSTNYHPSVVPVGRQNLVAAVISTDIKFFQFDKTSLDVKRQCSRRSLSPAASVSIRTRLITSSSSATCRGMSRSTVTGTIGRHRASPAATTDRVRGSAGHLVLSNRPSSHLILCTMSLTVQLRTADD